MQLSFVRVSGLGLTFLLVQTMCTVDVLVSLVSLEVHSLLDHLFSQGRGRVDIPFSPDDVYS